MAFNSFEFDIDDVLMACGVEYERNSHRTEVKGRCPVCGGKMGINRKKGVTNHFQDPSCPASGGMLNMYAAVYGCSVKEAKRQMMERLYGSYSAEQKTEAVKKHMQERKAQQKSVSEEPLRTVEERDATYSAMLGLLTLAKDHRENLVSRGLSAEAVETGCYRTFSYELGGELALKLLEKGLYIYGIPGFYMKGENPAVVQGKRGIIIPVRNRAGLIQGLQIRKDDALLEVKKTTESDGSIREHKENKYSWFSSKDRERGCSSPAAVHYAADFKDGRPIVPGGEIFLTEGPLKADIAHFITGKPFIAVPGVYIKAPLKEELKYLKENLGVEKLYNCYDMDYDTNPNVKAAVGDTYEIAESLGMRSIRITWDSRYKGIDDYLVSKGRQ